jgi:hypothetical protein
LLAQAGLSSEGELPRGGEAETPVQTLLEAGLLAPEALETAIVDELIAICTELSTWVDAEFHLYGATAAAAESTALSARRGVGGPELLVALARREAR